LEKVEELLTAKADVRQRGDKGLLPLDIAIRQRHVPMVSRLLIAKADPSNFLSPAIDTNNSEIVKIIVSAAPRSPSQLHEGLYAAIDKNNEEIVNVLLEANASPNPIKDGQTSLLPAAISTGNRDIARALLDAKANIDTMDYGNTPSANGNSSILHFSIHAQQSNMVELLLERKAVVADPAALLSEAMSKAETAFYFKDSNPDRLHASAAVLTTLMTQVPAILDIISNDKQKDLLLALMARNGQIDLVEKLLKVKADPAKPLIDGTDTLTFIKDNLKQDDKNYKDRLTAISLIAMEGHLREQEAIAKVKAAEAAKAAATAQIALYPALQKNDFKLAKTLIDTNADVNKHDEKVNTPLHIAVLEGNLDKVKFLLKEGANPKLVNKDKQTPFVLAQLHQKRSSPVMQAIIQELRPDWLKAAFTFNIGKKPEPARTGNLNYALDYALDNDNLGDNRQDHVSSDNPTVSTPPGR